MVLARLFRVEGITGWRRQIQIRFKAEKPPIVAAKAAPQKHSHFRVRPDFVFTRLKLAVFVDGCFWHGCPRHSNMPANNREFWLKKLTGNKARDRLVTRTLRRAGWRVLRIWEHELAPKHQSRCIAKLKALLV